MAEEHVDLALRIGHLEDSGLIATRVGAVRRVICASPAYLARRGAPATPDDLKDHDGITFRGFPIAPEWRYRKDGPAFAVEPRTRLAVNRRRLRSTRRSPALGSSACCPTKWPTSCGQGSWWRCWKTSLPSRCR